MNYDSLKAGELIRACAESGDPEAWREFVRRFQPLIAGVAYRAAEHWEKPSSSTIDDLVQEVFLKLVDDQCQILRDFREHWENGAFGFIRRVTANFVNDYFDKKYADKRGGGVPEENVDDIQCPLDSRRDGSAPRIERFVRLEEIYDCVRRCLKGDTAERDLRIFEFYFGQGYTALEIAHLPEIGLNVKGVESALLRMIRLVREELAKSKRKKKDRKGFPGTEPLLGGETQ